MDKPGIVTVSDIIRADEVTKFARNTSGIGERRSEFQAYVSGANAAAAGGGGGSNGSSSGAKAPLTSRAIFKPGIESNAPYTHARTHVRTYVRTYVRTHRELGACEIRNGCDAMHRALCCIALRLPRRRLAQCAIVSREPFLLSLSLSLYIAAGNFATLQTAN